MSVRALPTEPSWYLERLLMRWPLSMRLRLKFQDAKAREARIATRARAAQIHRIRLALGTVDVDTLCQVEQLLARSV